MAGWYDLLNSDPAAAATYNMGAPATPRPGRKGFLSGLYRMPVSFSNTGFDDMDYFNNAETGFGNSFNLLSSLYSPDLGNSMFYRWLTSGRGEGAARDAFSQLEASLRAGGRGEQTPTYMDFFKSFDPVSAFNRLSPQERGEDLGAYSPFTRFLSR